VESDFQVGRPEERFDSCGCGERYALGALKANWDQKIGPTKRVLKALEVAEHFSAGVRGPFNIVSI